MLLTFARHGYRKTSMEEVARTARICRPGLYFLFESKEALFRAAFTRALEQDLAAAEAFLAATDRPLRERLAGAFDRWAGTSRTSSSRTRTCSVGSSKPRRSASRTSSPTRSPRPWSGRPRSGSRKR
ncbi:TetR/AcrR family transcriptional regulator [Actinokineospora spheciospongiae]|uniref:TetR/AcrR family transcriptional regulator n=1 Tax=Actinokineospora spheciospongiae TaxID=909613 RepID=UPI001C63D62D|nr:helix-turn-helix domain-containing protein [Actinokineospora spheciospongiae]